MASAYGYIYTIFGLEASHASLSEQAPSIKLARARGSLMGTTGLHLMGMHLMSVHLIDVYFMGVYIPDPPSSKLWCGGRFIEI
jgi:hypothetical protein